MVKESRIRELDFNDCLSEWPIATLWPNWEGNVWISVDEDEEKSSLYFHSWREVEILQNLADS